MSANLKIVTYNIRCSWAWEGMQSFIHRAGFVWDTVKKESPDVIAFQEVTEEIYALLKDLLSDYLIVGQGRNADYHGEGLYTAIKKSTVDLIGLDTFWIGPEPFVPQSMYKHQNCPRICVTTTLRHKATNKLFRTYNIHLDNTDSYSRCMGIKCVLDQASIAYNKTPIPFVILGDFNAKPDDEAISICKDFAFKPIKDVAENLTSTYHEYGKLKDVKIDYMFMTEELSKCVKNVYPWDYIINDIYLSDHYPVCAVLEIE